MNNREKLYNTLKLYSNNLIDNNIFFRPNITEFVFVAGDIEEIKNVDYNSFGMNFSFEDYENIFMFLSDILQVKGNIHYLAIDKGVNYYRDGVSHFFYFRIAVMVDFCENED